MSTFIDSIFFCYYYLIGFVFATEYDNFKLNKIVHENKITTQKKNNNNHKR